MHCVQVIAIIIPAAQCQRCEFAVVVEAGHVEERSCSIALDLCALMEESVMVRLGILPPTRNENLVFSHFSEWDLEARWAFPGSFISYINHPLSCHLHFTSDLHHVVLTRSDGLCIDHVLIQFSDNNSMNLIFNPSNSGAVNASDTVYYLSKLRVMSSDTFWAHRLPCSGP